MFLSGLAMVLAGCGASVPVADSGPPMSELSGERLSYASADIAIGLRDILGPGDAGSLVRDSGWREYRLDIENRATRPIKVMDVRLLTVQGRYVASAAQYDEVRVPPDPGRAVAEDVARTSTGIAAGQAIPYGGAIVGMLSSVLSASSQASEGEARRDFALRRLKAVELAPGGRVSGSALLPAISDARALVVDYATEQGEVRIEMAFDTGG